MDFIAPIPNLYSLFDSRAQQQPEETALLACDQDGSTLETLTNEEFRTMVIKNALWLKSLGLKKGDGVALALPNSIEILMLSWTAWAMGIITVPLDMKKDTPDQHRYKVSVSQAGIVITQPNTFSAEMIGSFGKKVRIQELGGALDALIEGAARRGVKIDWMPDLSHQALILFTSGTTAKPKGAQLSLQNLIANADGIRDWFKIKDNDRFIVNLPLHHINSTSFCLATFLAGASIAVPPRYSHSKFWQQAAKTKSTFTSIVPTICYDQLSRQKEFDGVKNHLKLNRIQIGSAPVVVSDVKAFMEKFGIPLYQGYGQTETALRVTGVPLDLPKEEYLALVQGNGIGRAMKWAEIEIMDEQGKILGPGEEGELCVKGPIIMKGYLEDESQPADINQQAFHGDYFRTGDLAYFEEKDNQRYFYLKGRLKEIIIKGGVNLSPVAIEDKLKQLCPALEQVFVVGVADKRMGEEVAAVLAFEELSEKNEQLVTALKYRLTGPSQIISDFEKPIRLTVAKKSDLPFTSTGKVQRSQIKTMAFNWQPVPELVRNEAYRFWRLMPEQKAYIQQTLEIYNRSWHPLTTDAQTFAQQVKNGLVLVALDPDGRVQGFVECIRTRHSEAELSRMTYAKLTGDLTLSTHDPLGDKMVCVAIGTASHQPSEVKEVTAIPSVQAVKAYLKEGHDAVYNFHSKAKGGLMAGAELIAIIPNGRPEDQRALGYNMLLKYPSIKGKIITPDAGRSLATQLIEAAMAVFSAAGGEMVYAFSRPAGLAQWWNENQR